jgi:hypothetical protein
MGSLFSLSTLLRCLLAVGGVVVLALTWPVSRSTWLFHKTEAFYERVGEDKPYTVEEARQAIAAVDAALAASPTASHYVQRSDLLANLAASRTQKFSNEQRRTWHKQAKADLERGLANDPARALDWLRLAIVNQWLDGPSRDIPPLLFMSIDTGRYLALLWPGQFRLILDNWGYVDDEQKAMLSEYIRQMWRLTADRRPFASRLYDPVDEAILRTVLQGEPGAQEDLTKWLMNVRGK